MDLYQVLEKELHVLNDLMPVLKNVVSREEAQILVLITKDFSVPFKIANELGEKNVKIVELKLRNLYQRGLVERKKIRGREAYQCRSFLDIVRQHLEEGRYEALGLEYLHALRNYYITTRIRKTENAIQTCQLKYSSKVIPIEKAIEVSRYVLPTRQAITILKKAKLIALTKCGCRTAFQNCDKPVDVCLMLDKEAEYLVNRGYAKPISIEKAREILKIANKAGLVHLTLYVPSQKIYVVCSCCPCCCHDLQALIKYGKKLLVAKSDYIATVDREKCIGCGECVKRCVFNARKTEDGKSIIIEENCYGCGLCVTTCPTRASTLILKNFDYNENKNTVREKFK